jgi:plastocyanin
MRAPKAAAAAVLLGLAGFGCGSDATADVVADLSASLGDAGDLGEPAGDDDAGAAFFVSVGPGGGNRFSPQTLFVPVGARVTWLWVNGVHGVVSDDDPPAFPPSPVQSGGRYSVTFATAGQLGYHCSVHGLMMTGVIVVQ